MRSTNLGLGIAGRYRQARLLGRLEIAQNGLERLPQGLLAGLAVGGEPVQAGHRRRPHTLAAVLLHEHLKCLVIHTDRTGVDDGDWSVAIASSGASFPAAISKASIVFAASCCMVAETWA